MQCLSWSLDVILTTFIMHISVCTLSQAPLFKSHFSTAGISVAKKFFSFSKTHHVLYKWTTFVVRSISACCNTAHLGPIKLSAIPSLFLTDMKSVSPRITLFGARLEAHLTTHAFTLLFHVFYVLSLFLLFVLGFYTEFVDKKPPVVLWFLSFARGTGYTLNLNTAFILLISSRLFLTKLRRTPLSQVLPLDAAFPTLHILSGYIITVSVIFHASFHLTWIIVGNGWSPGLFGFTMSVVTGFLLLGILALIFAVALPLFRSKHFRLFRLLHVGGAILFFALLIFHGMFRERPETYKWITPVLIIYTLDRIFRRVKACTAILSLSADNAALRGDILVLRVPRPFDFQAGQYAEIQVPSVNIEWHPFTIASAPHEEVTSFFIKVHGDWTGKLCDEMQTRLQGEQDQPLKVLVRGPFGAPAQHVGSYDRVVLVSGGVGATPFAAICKDLHYKNTTANLLGDMTKERPVYDVKAFARFDERVRVAIFGLYGVDVHDKFNASAETEQKSIFVTNMLNLTGNDTVVESNRGSESTAGSPESTKKFLSDDADTGGSSASTNKKANNTTLTGSHGTVVQQPELAFHHKQFLAKNLERSDVLDIRKARPDEEEEVLRKLSRDAQRHRSKRQNRARMYECRARLLTALHSTRTQFLMILIVLARLAVAGIGSILRKKMEQAVVWVAVADTPLAFTSGIVVFVTIVLELSYMRWQYFSDIGRCTDALLLVPLSVASTALDLETVIDEVDDREAQVILQNAIILPLFFTLLVVRLHRSVRLRSLLTSYRRKQKKDSATEVDFVWTTRGEDDDTWLRDELSPLADGTDLRLHRYVTRAKEVDVEAGADSMTSVYAGRPDWDDMFYRIAASAPSRAVIGVFFCGPKSMGHEVQAALRRAEIGSHLRAAYLSRTPERTLQSDLGIPHGFIVRRLQTHGCSVRFSFRKENF